MHQIFAKFVEWSVAPAVWVVWSSQSELFTICAHIMVGGAEEAAKAHGPMLHGWH